MSLQTVTVVILPVDAAEPLAQEAALVARLHDAHLLGVAVSEDPRYYPAIDTLMATETISELNRHQEAMAEKIRVVFEKAVAREGVRGEWRRAQSGLQTMAERILESGRSADLLVLGRPASYVHQIDDLHEQIIRGLGRPVLIMPQGAALDGHPKHALVGWSRTREAVRAAFDTLLLLEPEGTITLLNVGAQSAHDLADGPMNDLAAALSRHGVSVTVTHREPGGETAAEVIQREAKEIGASFIASGAFGHSRAYDFVVGAVTRQLLQECQLPMLFSK